MGYFIKEAHAIMARVSPCPTAVFHGMGAIIDVVN